MCNYFAQVTVIANVVPYPVFRTVRPFHRATSGCLAQRKGFQDGTRIGLSSAEVIHLRYTRSLPEFKHESRDVLGVDIIPHLLTFVTADAIRTTLDIASNEITQESVQFDARVVRPSQATSAQTTGRHIKIAAVLLHQNIPSQLRGAEE